MKISSDSVFDNYTNEYEEWFEKNRFTYLSELELLKELIPRPKNGLEIGIGTGRFSAPIGIEFGIDPSKNMLKIARKLGSKVALARGENLPFRDEIFDYVLIMVTICFVDDPDVVMDESMRVLKNDGKIMVGIIDRDSWLGNLYLAKKDKSKFYREARFFSAGEIMELLKNHNFKDISSHQTLFNPPDMLDAVQHYEEGCGEGGFAVICGYKRRFNN